MEIQKERIGDTYVISANGRLDGIYSTAFAKEVGELIVGTNPKILIDFAEIDFVTSAGIRAVLLLMKKAEASGVVFALCGVKNRCAKSSTSPVWRRLSLFTPGVPRASRL
jgi:anti-anti-sigma factor